MQKSSFSFKCDFNLSQNLLLKKIQHASINRQIKKRIGLTLWRILFKGCWYEVDSDLITIIASNERVADIITRRYKMPLEKFFNVRVSVETSENGHY